MNRFVIGDIHGAFRALKVCLEKAQFDYQTDLLIVLGDVCDGWPDVKESINELLKIKNLTYILGNHDHWALEWIKTGIPDKSWIVQGGENTMKSYDNGVPKEHKKLLNNALPFYRTKDKLFVHGGFYIDIPLEKQDITTFLWDRTLIETAILLDKKQGIDTITEYKEIYIGHTPTIRYGISHPTKFCEVWMMDTGAGWTGGKLSMMNIDTKEVFISDNVESYYPDVKGRG